MDSNTPIPTAIATEALVITLSGADSKTCEPRTLPRDIANEVELERVRQDLGGDVVPYFAVRLILNEQLGLDADEADVASLMDATTLAPAGLAAISLRLERTIAAL